MTDLLNKAFDAASRLPRDEQDALAEWLLAELASEEGWRERFAETHNSLSVLAREAFWHLDAPVERLAVDDVPMPYHPVLLDAVLPDSERIADRIGELLRT